MNTVTTIIGWNSVPALEGLKRCLAKPFRRTRNETTAIEERSPAVDFSESEKEYIVKARLPRMEKDQITITMQRHVLTIFGKAVSGKDGHSNQGGCGRAPYGVSCALPKDADETHVAAHYKNGTLNVHIPKLNKVKPETIEVPVG